MGRRTHSNRGKMSIYLTPNPFNLFDELQCTLTFHRLNSKLGSRLRSRIPGRGTTVSVVIGWRRKVLGNGP